MLKEAKNADPESFSGAVAIDYIHAPANVAVGIQLQTYNWRCNHSL